MAKAKTKNVLTILIAIVYLVFGALAAWRNFGLSLSALVATAMGVIMFIAGFIALFGGNRKLCRVFGIIIFIVAVVSLIMNWFSIWGLIGAILAWAFIVLIK